jgi:ribosomal protein S18 acetylase RimI-like enzyme
MPRTSEDTLVHIRPATEADADRLAEIDRFTWSPVTSPVPLWPDDKPFLRDAEHLRDTLVALDGEVVVGYVQVRRSPIAPASAHVQQVNGLAVHPAHQGRRIGHALMAAAETRARRRGARRVTLRVLGGNAPARALYLSCGYHIEGVLEGEFLLEGRYVDDVLMALDLTPDAVTPA